MNQRNFVTVTRLLLATLLLISAATEGIAQQSHPMMMSPEQMIKSKTTAAQRKAAAARAASRRAAAAAQQAQRSAVVSPNAPVGPPGGGGALPSRDQLYFGIYPNYANSPLPQVTVDPVTGAVTGVVPNTGIRKFVDGLPGLTAAGANNLGQYIPIANPDTTTFPGSDYYEISLNQFTTEKMHSDLPPTTLRGYVQTNNGTDAQGNNTIAPAPYHYLGPLIIAQQNRPVRVKFSNNLPTGAGGNLFIPVDQTVMGAGNGLAIAQSPYLQNRATLHLHGGNTPWISDGTPHQWTVPAGEFLNTLYPRGDSTQYVPDMFFDPVTHQVIPQCTAARTTSCSPVTLPVPNPSPLPPGATNDPGSGSMTFFWTNQQSARLMFYHDHAYGITRLNVYAGEAAGYLLLDPTDLTLMGNGTVPGLADTIPLVIQDKTFVPPNPASAPVYSVAILANGSGYNAATTTVAFLGGTCATPPTATATVGNMLDPFGKLVINAVTGITLTNGGSCSVPPSVVIADTGAIPGTGAAAFASLATLGAQDPTWDPALWGGPGNFWFPHFYMTNQWPDNPDGSGVNPMGRWDYAQWFWPPFGNGIYRERGPIPCPTVVSPNQTCPGFPTALDPAPVTDMMGAGSVASLTPEAFMDTPVVNGTAYPTVTVQPKAYRLRILSAGNDRTFNLSWFIACGTGGYTAAANATCPTTPGVAPGTEVGMVPSAPTPGWPVQWPTDGRDGGVPDPAGMGPSWIQIGTEGGFLPNPVVIPPTPVGYEYFRRSITVLNISSHGLLLMPAERADVIVDFSAFAGKTLILYNDAPTPAPAFDPRYDYYTGDPDQTGTGGAPSTLAGYGPNTRTIMQVHVAPVAATPFNPAALSTALPAAFKATQPVPVVPEAAYNNAFGANFPNTYAKIADTSMTFTPINGAAPVTVPTENKAIQELFELDYGRMNATLGTELKFTNFNNQTTIPFGYVDPTTEIIQDSANVIGQPVGVAGDGSQIWKIVHNGVDSHAIHFHLFNVQVINRVGWDGSVRTPDSNELGWKDTVRMNPLEIIYVALRPTSQTLPWPIPDSIRKLDVTMPEGPDPAMSAVGPNGNPVPQTNVTANFGWEYVWHCHILGHEENDMMRAIRFQVPPATPANLGAFGIPPTFNLSWTDMSVSASQPGGGFNLQRAADQAFTQNVVNFNGIGGSTGFGSTVSFVDSTAPIGNPQPLIWYRVQAFSANGTSPWSPPIMPGVVTTATTISAVSPINYGQVGVATVTVTGTSNGLPVAVTGNVTLTVDGGAAIIQALAGTPGQTIFNLAGLTVGTHTLVATYPDVANPFILGSTATTTIVVNPAPLTITAPSATIPYGSAVPPITPIIVGLVPPDTQASLGPLLCTTTYTQGSPQGTYPTSCSGAVNANYTISYVAGTITVTAVPLTITASSATIPYGSAVPVITPIYVGFVNGETAANLTTQPTCSTTYLLGSPVGAYPTTCSGAVDPNYTISYVPGSVTVTAVPLTITASSATIPYGSAVPVITPIYAGFVNGETAANLTTPPTCSTTYIVGSPVSGSPYPSSCVGAVDPNYTISYVAGTVTVTAVPLTITASSAIVPYGGAIPVITPSYTGFVAGDTAAKLTTQPTCSTTYIVGSPVSGSPYPSSCVGAVDPNYTITYAPGTVTVTAVPLTITASSATITYGSAVPVITAGYAGFVNGDTAASLTTQPTCTTTYTTTPPNNAVGTYPATCSGAVDPNYTIGYVAGTVTVTAAPLTIPAGNGTMPYGGPVPLITPSYAGFVNGDTAASLTTQPTCSTTATTTSPVGTYPTTCSGAVDPNYTISYLPGTMTVNPTALTITASSGTMSYGGAVSVITASYTGFVAGDTAAKLTTQPTCSTTATSASPVGSYPSTCSGAVDPNYVISYVGGNVTVTAVPLTITASSATIAYGSAVPAITPSYAGFVNGDTVANLTTPATCSTTYTTSSPVGAYPSTCSGAVDPNYTIGYVAGTVNVTQIAASVTPNPNSKIFGQADPVPLTTGTLVGFLAKDNVTATYTRNAGENVGTYTITATLGPAGVLGNYAITYNTALFAINKATSVTTITSNVPNPSGVNQPVTVSFTVSPQFSGTPTGNITVTANTGDSCTGALSAGAGSCAMVLVSPGSKTLTATYAGDTNFLSSTSAPVSQVVRGGVAFVSPTALAFGNQLINTNSAPQTATLSNLGNGTLTINSISIGGANAGDFSRTTTCGATLAAGASCNINVRFRPTAVGPRSASVLISTNDPVNPTLTVTLTGTGVAPAATLSPTSLTFPAQRVGTTSAPQTVTITSSGGSALVITSISIAGGNASNFAQTNNCPIGGAGLAVGSSCTVNVTFRPNRTGLRTSNLRIADNAPGSPQNVPLSGTGQ